MDDEERKLAGKELLGNFVDEHLGTHIDHLVKSTGHEELKPCLKNFFAEFLVVGNSIKAARDPAEFETEINKASDLLTTRIQEAKTDNW